MFSHIEDAGSVLRWALVLGTFLVTVDSIRSCSLEEDVRNQQQLNKLVAQGYDPVVARCAVYGSNSNTNSGTTCALAIQAQALTSRPLPKEVDHADQ